MADELDNITNNETPTPTVNAVGAKPPVVECSVTSYKMGNVECSVKSESLSVDVSVSYVASPFVECSITSITEERYSVDITSFNIVYNNNVRIPLRIPFRVR